jgi:hypothetical protein
LAAIQAAILELCRIDRRMAEGQASLGLAAQARTWTSIITSAEKLQAEDDHFV